MRGYRLIVALVAFSWPCWADTISYSDTEFATADWASIEIVDTGGGGTVSTAQQATGGNPGAFLDGLHTWVLPGAIWYGHEYGPAAGASVDPSLGAILSIDFSADVSALAGGTVSTQNPDPAVAFSAFLVQGGTYYRALYLAPRVSEGWVTLAGTGLTETSFYEIDSATGGVILTSSPDFSTGGAAITFGVVTANSSGGSGQTVLRNWGVDNWSVTVTTDSGGSTDPVPEPGTFALFGAALIGFAVYRRRRATS